MWIEVITRDAKTSPPINARLQKGNCTCCGHILLWNHSRWTLTLTGRARGKFSSIIGSRPTFAVGARKNWFSLWGAWCQQCKYMLVGWLLLRHIFPDGQWFCFCKCILWILHVFGEQLYPTLGWDTWSGSWDREGADQHSNGTTSQARQQHKFKFTKVFWVICLHMIRYQYDWHYETLVKDNHISLSDALWSQKNFHFNIFENKIRSPYMGHWHLTVQSG